MSHIQPQPHPTAGVIPNKGHDSGDHYAPELMDKTGTGTYISSENERNGVPVPGNEVLEHDAQTKGRWFQYLKTKQFWITLLLGQGMSSYNVHAEATTDNNMQFSRSALRPLTPSLRFSLPKELQSRHSSPSSTTFYSTSYTPRIRSTNMASSAGPV